MKKILLIILIIMINGCSSVVTFPDGKIMRFQKGFGMRNFEASFKDNSNRKEYKAKGDSNFKLPDLNILSLPK